MHIKTKKHPQSFQTMNVLISDGRSPSLTANG